MVMTSTLALLAFSYHIDKPSILKKIQGTGANAGRSRMSGPPPGLQRKKAMDSDAKTATLKVTCEYVCFGVCLIATCQCLNGK